MNIITMRTKDCRIPLWVLGLNLQCGLEWHEQPSVDRRRRPLFKKEGKIKTWTKTSPAPGCCSLPLKHRTRKTKERERLFICYYIFFITGNNPLLFVLGVCHSPQVSLETAWNLWLHRLAWSQATGLFLHSWQSPILTCFQTDGPFDYKWRWGQSPGQAVLTLRFKNTIKKLIIWFFILN